MAFLAVKGAYLPLITVKQMDAILPYLDRFEAGRLRNGNSLDKPDSPSNQAAAEFVESLYKNGWVASDFDWPRWQKSAVKYVKSPNKIGRADVETIRKLFTTHLRKDRFCEADLAYMFESGHILSLLRRLKTIRGEMRKQTMDPVLRQFRSQFTSSFKPPRPYRGKNGKSWLLSRVWSNYMRTWLRRHYSVQFEHRHGRGRLDAAIWSKNKEKGKVRMDIALEWEWDNNKVANDFSSGDLRKCLKVDANCGLVIVQTRTDGKRGVTQCDKVLNDLFKGCEKFRGDSRSIAIIEIRRVLQRKDLVEFVVYFLDPDQRRRQEICRWSYS